MSTYSVLYIYTIDYTMYISQILFLIIYIPDCIIQFVLNPTHTFSVIVWRFDFPSNSETKCSAWKFLWLYISMNFYEYEASTVTREKNEWFVEIDLITCAFMRKEFFLETRTSIVVNLFLKVASNLYIFCLCSSSLCLCCFDNPVLSCCGNRAETQQTLKHYIMVKFSALLQEKMCTANQNLPLPSLRTTSLSSTNQRKQGNSM